MKILNELLQENDKGKYKESSLELIDLDISTEPSIVIPENVPASSASDSENPEDTNSPAEEISQAEPPVEEKVVYDTLVLSQKLQKAMLKLKGKFLSDDGHSIDYIHLKGSSEFREYEDLARDLNYVNLDELKSKQRMVFFINVYNALTIHGLTIQDPMPISVLEVHHFWKSTAYKIGAYKFSLDDIEHGILRGNKPHPTSTTPCMKMDDPRMKFMISSPDPRIHFALNCGAKSCPAIQVYTEENLSTALDMAARNFCEAEVKCNLKEKTITLSKIFQWYQKDFAENEVNLLKYIKQFIPETTVSVFDNLLCTLVQSGGVTVKYGTYDWGINFQKTSFFKRVFVGSVSDDSTEEPSEPKTMTSL